jgi:hypothetical protein
MGKQFSILHPSAQKGKSPLLELCNSQILTETMQRIARLPSTFVAEEAHVGECIGPRLVSVTLAGDN